MFILDFPREVISNGRDLKTANFVIVSVIKVLAYSYLLSAPTQLLPEL